MTKGGEYLIGLPKILELPELKIDRNNRMALESGALNVVRKVRPGKFCALLKYTLEKVYKYGTSSAYRYLYGVV